jgi:predicted membrane-bound spermidine synthase
MIDLKRLGRYRYEAIAFLTGASVMTLEIVGARLMSPKFGASTYVWTAMIGVILASMAVGFYLGGKLADRKDHAKFLGHTLLVAAVGVLMISLYHEWFLGRVAALGLDLRLGALLSAILLFSLPSMLIGMVSPHLAKASVTSLETTGRSIGRLEAAGAVGSIAGTFACGYFLLGHFGSRSIVIGIAGLLLLTSLLAGRGALTRQRLICAGLLALAAVAANANPPSVLADVDTSYARYRVYEGRYAMEPVNMLLTDDSSIQSAVSKADPNALVFTYTKAFYAAARSYGSPERVLVIGGGTHTFPSALVAGFPQVHVDVVEIDPALDKLAVEYFGFKGSPRLQIHHADGRAYLNTNGTAYDLIYMDAFSSLSPPFQLTTSQAVGRIHGSLTGGGAVVANIISRYDGGNDGYLRAAVTTYREHFRYVALAQAVPGHITGDARPNFMLFASDSKQTFDKLLGSAPAGKLPLQPGGQVLTDDFAPVERLLY